VKQTDLHKTPTVDSLSGFLIAEGGAQGHDMLRAPVMLDWWVKALEQQDFRM
jgi:hypothetical protein